MHLQLGNTLGHALANKVEMARLALNHTPQGNDGIHLGVFGKELRSEGQLEGARHILDLDVVVGASCGTQRTHSTLQQGLGDLTVPLGHHDAELHVGSRRQRSVKLREIVVSGSHLQAGLAD